MKGTVARLGVFCCCWTCCSEREREFYVLVCFVFACSFFLFRGLDCCQQYFVAVGIAQSDIQVDSDLGCHNSGSFGYWSLGVCLTERIWMGFVLSWRWHRVPVPCCDWYRSVSRLQENCTLRTSPTERSFLLEIGSVCCWIWRSISSRSSRMMCPWGVCNLARMLLYEWSPAPC